MKVTALDGRECTVLPLDFETYYEEGRGAQFTLSKMTTTSYVRDERFKVHGLSAGEWAEDGTHHVRWLTGHHIGEFLKSVDWAHTALLCHNTAFDGFVLSQAYGHIPHYYLDTQSMSRGEFGPSFLHGLNPLSQRLGHGEKLAGSLEATANKYHLTPEVLEALGTYAVQDVVLLMKDFETLYKTRGYPLEELHLIHLTIKMFCDPKLVVDNQLCIEEINAEITNKSRLVAASGVSASHLSSAPKFAELLRSRGVEPPTKISPTTNREAYAFAKSDLDFMALLGDPRVTDLIQARLAVKSTLGETRGHRLIAHGRPTLPVMLQYCGAVTHRWTAGDKMNMQNLPSGKKGGSDRLRRSILAPKGHKLVIIDAAQIDLRTGAMLAGEVPLLETLREGKDPYVDIPQRIFPGQEISKHVNSHLRNLGKTAELSLLYGVGHNKFHKTAMADQIPVTEDETRRIVAEYRKLRTGIVGTWAELDTNMRRMATMNPDDFLMWRNLRFESDRVMMPTGLWLQYPGFISYADEYDRVNFRYRGRDGYMHMYPAKMFQHIVQSLARSVFAYSALLFAQRYPDTVLLVHDEQVTLVPTKEADDALEYAYTCFRTPPPWMPDIPLDCEGCISPHYLK